jgi:hypothetical protein
MSSKRSPYSDKSALAMITKPRAQDEELPKEVEEGGRQAVGRVVNVSREVGGTEDGKWFHWIAGAKDITRAL